MQQAEGGPWSRGMTSPLRGEGRAFESHRAHSPSPFTCDLVGS